MGSLQNKDRTALPGQGALAFRKRLLVTAVQAVVMGVLPAAVWAQQETTAPALAETTLKQVEVTAERETPHREPGAVTTIEAEQLEQAKSLEDIVRYQPSVTAPGVATGASRNKSSFDRGGTTGYNIRGIEGNRVGMDVDGVELPAATGRPYVSRVGNNTFGVGRDFIDPEMYSGVDINLGTTNARRSAGGIGGAVGFRTKSSENYLTGDKTSYFNGKLSYDSVDRSWNQSMTVAGRSGDYDGLIAHSRRDGQEARNNSRTVQSYPNAWNSDALLLKGGVRVSADHRLVASADLYRRRNESQFDGWDNAGGSMIERSEQNSHTARNTLQLNHQWTPANGAVDRLDTRVYAQTSKTDDVTDTTTLGTGALAHNVSGSQTKGVGASTTADKRVGDQRLSFGANASIERTERPWSVSGYMKPQPDTTTTRLGAFVQDEISFYPGGKRLAVIPAVRVDRVEIESRNLDQFVSGALTLADAERIYGSPASSTIVSPSLGLIYDLTPTFSAYVQYKRGGRAPGAGEVFGSWNMNANYSASQYALVGNRDLKQETSNAFDFGVKGSPTPGVLLNASLYYTQYKDFIAYTRYARSNPAHASMFTNVPSNISIIYQAENRDEATIYGFDLSTRLDHGQWLQVAKGTYSTWALGVSRGTSKSNYVGDKDLPLDSVLPYKAVIGLGYDAPQKQWGTNLMGTFVASKQATATTRDSYANGGATIVDSTTVLYNVPGYALFDLTGYWQINKTWRMNAGIYNLGDKRYWDYSSARSLQVQPTTLREQRDMELLSNPGRSYAVALSATF